MVEIFQSLKNSNLIKNTLKKVNSTKLQLTIAELVTNTDLHLKLSVIQINRNNIKHFKKIMKINIKHILNNSRFIKRLNKNKF